MEPSLESLFLKQQVFTLKKKKEENARKKQREIDEATRHKDAVGRVKEIIAKLLIEESIVFPIKHKDLNCFTLREVQDASDELSSSLIGNDKFALRVCHRLSNCEYYIDIIEEEEEEE